MKALEAETYVHHMSLNPNQLQAKVRHRMRSVGQIKFIARHAKTITTTLKATTSPKRTPIQNTRARKIRLSPVSHQ